MFLCPQKVSKRVFMCQVWLWYLVTDIYHWCSFLALIWIYCYLLFCWWSYSLGSYVLDSMVGLLGILWLFLTEDICNKALVCPPASWIFMKWCLLIAHLLIPLLSRVRTHGILLVISHKVRLPWDFSRPKAKWNPTAALPSGILLIGLYNMGSCFYTTRYEQIVRKDNGNQEVG